MSYTAVLTAAVLVLALYFVFRPQGTIRRIAGPPSPSWIFGHMRQLILCPRYGDNEFKWVESYGPVYRLRGCFGQDRLMVADPRALQYMVNSSSFSRAPALDNMAKLLFGEKSIGVARGSEHRRLRSALNVGFSAAAVRSYRPVFQKVAEMVSDQFDNFTDTTNDVCSTLSIATLSAISEAILGQSTRDLGEEFVANNIAITKLTANQSETNILSDVVGSYLPVWLWRAVIYLPIAAFAVVRKEKLLVEQIGTRIVREKIDAAKRGLESNNDLYSLLVKPDTRTLSDEDLVNQIAVILIAGQETVTNTIAFGLLELARHPELQDKIRAEIHSTVGDTVHNVAYDAMPLLNAFIKETLRLYPAEALRDTVATQDTIIPLAKSIITTTGECLNQIPIRKGQLVTMAIASYQRLTPHWGNDTHQFNPSRWLDGETYQGEAVGPYANLLTFFGGPHACLGYRFAVSEMQMLFCELVRKFSFAEPNEEPIRPQMMTTLQPIDSQGKRALPLCITRIL
ncbi:cytochrome P450 [Mycena galopus ATCC 62051]|nr:cytochrome P450 [Mycena galopus ATCC 62051]